MPFSKVKKRIVYACFIFLFTCIAAEVLLRIYNPFETSVAGDKITLRTNTEFLVNIGPNTKDLDDSAIVKKNSLGFRGQNPPANQYDYLTIVAVGGSTTECLYITEGRTWPDLLSQKLQQNMGKVWINNAGLNGHSTFAHIQLMDYITKLKPDIALFLVGCNDVDRPDLSSFDSSIHNNRQTAVVTMARYSKLVNVLLNFYRHRTAVRRQLDNNVNFSLQAKDKLVLSDSIIKARLVEKAPLVKQYGTRIKQLIDICRQSNIEPVFITQPCLLGDTTDDVTGVDMSTFPLGNKNGKLTWAALQMYNDETRVVCNNNNVYVIELANQLPKSSKYFYDAYHFNNTGCREVSEIIYEGLSGYFSGKPDLLSPKH